MGCHLCGMWSVLRVVVCCLYVVWSMCYVECVNSVQLSKGCVLSALCVYYVCVVGSPTSLGLRLPADRVV